MKQNNNQISIVKWGVPAVIVAACVGAIVASTGFERMPPILKRGIQPSDFPQIVAGLIIMLAIISIRWEPQKIQTQINKTAVITIAIIATFPIFTLIDFFIALAIVAAAISIAWGERRIMMICTVALVIPAAVFILFDVAFDVRFPRGILTNLWYG